MGDVLAVNAGSTSLKLHLVREDETVQQLDRLEDAEASEVEGVGHRVVHGGTRFRDPVAIDDEVDDAIRELSTLAPLHNAPALAAIDEARAAFRSVPHVAVFDTAFHATIPPAAATYAVPLRWREEWGIRRYGFHGLSVEWASGQVRARRLVVCHLGGGCSVTAVLDGRSVDTTMGFSPLEGVPMATRSGSVDPGVLIHVLRERGLPIDELDRALEHESGLLALGGSQDVRHLEGTLGLEVYVHRIAGAVASMAVALGGLDAVAFTGGVGEGSAVVRDRIVELLAFLGGFRVEVVESREELVIARAVRTLLAG